ncbi:hypothetical protein B0H17DRAFT_1138552 [Mycena rosella]|uniref:Mid2 domain-containing protein n=1 Tax=Mycena rosella TaxID=1033263 RepID=A0AAD7D6D8_MYCRO|nr:hypothetical protein B0H17DRAFT_1138552 [Mycena rosella]
MGPWLALALPLLLCGLHTTLAADPDVFPGDANVPQCTMLTVLWSQPHLHVQPGNLINVTNLVDLGPQLNNTFIKFDVALKIGQNFSFAYNTIKDPFTVFQSNVMQVVSGTTDCLPGHSSSSSSAPSFNVSGASSTISNIPPPSSSISTSSTTVAAQTSTAKKPFPIAPVVGSVCALAGIIIGVGLAFCWTSRRRSRRLRASLHPVPEEHMSSPHVPVLVQAPIVSRGQPGGPITPYQESASTARRGSTKYSRIRGNRSSSGAGVSTIGLNSPSSAMPTPHVPSEISNVEDGPPAYHDHTSLGP